MTEEIAIHNLYALKQRTRALSDQKALDMAIKALESQNRLTEMLNKQINAYVEQNKNRHLSDLEYGRKTAYTHCMEVLENDD